MGDELMEKNKIHDDDPRDKDHPNLDLLPWSKCVATSRYGILANVPVLQWVNGVNNWQACNAVMKNPQWYGNGSGSFADAVSRIFSPGYFESWETFASAIHNSPKNLKDNPSEGVSADSPADPRPRKATSFMSLEFIHNIIRNATGGLYMADSDIIPPVKGYKGLGLGHMSDVPVATFDPIFWLHHCNIDRLVAIWQTLNWHMWFDDPQKGKDPPATADPLLPFHYDTEKHLWSSDRARYWKELGYQYDDLVPQPNTPEDSPKYLEDLQKHIKELYPSTSSIVQGTPGYTLPNGKFNDYIINVIYDRYALKGRAYAISFFIGKPPERLSNYRESEIFVGAVYTFSAPVIGENGSTACDNCAQQSSQAVLSKAQIPITVPLLAAAPLHAPIHAGDPPQVPIPGIGLGALDSRPVESILHDPVERLQWKFVALGGTEIEAEKFPKTEIAVLHGYGSHPVEDDQMPEYHKYKILKRGVKNQYLGFGHDDTRLKIIRDDPDADEP